MVLTDIPRGQIEKSITEAARGLNPDPGPGFKGDCDMFRRADGFPICRGTCKPGRDECGLIIVCREGRHSDLYDVLVICSCKTWEELLREYGARQPEA